MQPSEQEVRTFQKSVWEFYRVNGRPMPWRENTNPYYVLVSELMLQQTQVNRVIPKFEAFIWQFPTIEALAQTDLGDVLRAWQGLGYNRRAKYLHEAAKKIVHDFDGVFPTTQKELESLPGIGPNTAGALRAYAFMQSAVFIETNIRTVLFYHFFDQESTIPDSALRLVMAQVLDREHPREFYWALMDYGSYLKAQGAGRLAMSKHYKKQSPLAGSLREMRGKIIRALSQGALTEAELETTVNGDERFKPALLSLESEGLVRRDEGQRYTV